MIIQHSNSYHARVEDTTNGVIHSITTWKTERVLQFLAQFHVEGTRLTFTLYPMGAPPTIISDVNRAYRILREDVGEIPRTD